MGMGSYRLQLACVFHPTSLTVGGFAVFYVYVVTGLDVPSPHVWRWHGSRIESTLPLRLPWRPFPHAAQVAYCEGGTSRFLPLPKRGDEELYKKMRV